MTKHLEITAYLKPISRMKVTSLTTLLLYLCIYILRLQAAELSRLQENSNPSLSIQPAKITTTTTTITSSQNHQTHTKKLSTQRLKQDEPKPPQPVEMEIKEVEQGAVYEEIACPIEQVLNEASRRCKGSMLKRDLQTLVADVAKKASVVWKKDNSPIHREVGDPILYNLGSEMAMSKNSLILIKVASQDAGQYRCEIDYHNLTSKEIDCVSLIPSISYRVRVAVNTIPDTKPYITHPPTNEILPRGSDVTFTCNAIQTRLAQMTYWFKSCPIKNQTSTHQFIEAYNSTMATEFQLLKVMGRYIINNAHSHEYTVMNISDDDSCYYGCAVTNPKGLDIRVAQLTLTDMPPPPIALSKFIKNHPPIEASTQHPPSTINYWLLIFCVIISTCFFMLIALACSGRWCTISFLNLKEQKMCQNYGIQKPLIPSSENCKESDSESRQHLPPGGCPDMYNIGKSSTAFITGHFAQSNGHYMTQSVSCRNFDKDKNPSISSSNSNQDEASSWGKSSSSHGDNSRAFYSHTSNLTSTTVPMYDHPPSTNAAHYRGPSSYQDACIINPCYGLVKLNSNSIDWVFPRRNLERQNMIGEGQFGQVWRYIARQKDGSETVVAVKTLKDRIGLGNHEQKLQLISEMIAEIEIMKSVNEHPNVIKLLNYCIDDHEPILLIMEYAENGKLQTYLRNCRSLRKVYPHHEHQSFVTSKELIKFSYHIAKGMEYVASKGIIHRDLASRNILVSRDRVCKVADFGFARRVNNGCAYERTTANPVPVKWMSPEALVENKFTSKSDVFSFGILMWEIVTLGATPYDDMSSLEVYKKVTSGGRLDKPVHCKDEFYEIMAKCWVEESSQRPTFAQLAGYLEKLLLSDNDYIELDQYPEHAYYNILNTQEKEIVVL